MTPGHRNAEFEACALPAEPVPPKCAPPSGGPGFRGRFARQVSRGTTVECPAVGPGRRRFLFKLFGQFRRAGGSGPVHLRRGGPEGTNGRTYAPRFAAPNPWNPGIEDSNQALASGRGGTWRRKKAVPSPARSWPRRYQSRLPLAFGRQKVPAVPALPRSLAPFFSGWPYA